MPGLASPSPVEVTHEHVKTLTQIAEKFQRLQCFIAENPDVVSAYLVEGSYALQYRKKADQIKTGAAEILKKVEEGDLEDFNTEFKALLNASKTTAEDFISAFGKENISKWMDAQKNKDEKALKDKHHGEQVSSSNAGNERKRVDLSQKVQAEADAYIAEMRSKFTACDNSGGTINRGAYYGHPNGAPPPVTKKISKDAMDIVKVEAVRLGFELKGSLTANLSFHKTMTKGASSGVDFIFHI